MRAATAHFERRELAAAEQEFAQALALATTDAERAALEFNLASCAFELGRYAEAEAAFLRSAALDPADAALARLDAGLAAARDGRVAAARAHLAAAGQGDAEVEARRQELEQELARLETDVAATTRRATIADSAAALQGGDPARAARLLEQLLADPGPGSDAERADLHYAAAAAYLSLGDRRAARAHVEAAIALAPTDPELYVKRAEIELAAGEEASARRDLEHALALGLSGASASWARTRLAALDPLPSSGPAGSLYVGAGYDSNPAQSGTSEASGVTLTSANEGSPLLSAMGRLAFTGRLGARLAGRAEYLPTVFYLTDPTFRDLGIQAHEVDAYLYVAASSRVLVRLGAVSSMLLAGFEPPEPFLWENGGGLRLDVRTGQRARTRVELQARAVHGYAEQEPLGGAREDAALLELLDLGDLSLTLGARFRAVQAGTAERALTAADYPACGAACEGAVYEIPFSYLAPIGSVDLTGSIGSRLLLGMNTSVEWRQYLADSQIRTTGAGAGRLRADSAKTRHDLRVRAGVDAEVALDAHGHVALTAGYGLLVTRSNVAYDPNDPEHDLDYDDRQYVQHIGEGGLEVRF